MIIILKGFLMQPVIKQIPVSVSFSFLIEYWNWSDFVDKLSLFMKIKKNWKIVIEIFCQKLRVSNVILAFLDHLKPKLFFVSQPWWPT